MVVSLVTYDLESMRRSMPLLRRTHPGRPRTARRLCGDLLAERVRIERLVMELGPAAGRASRAIYGLYRACGTTLPESERRRRAAPRPKTAKPRTKKTA